MLPRMSEGMETIGAGVSDAMLTRAVEPEHGEANGGLVAKRCLNCGAFLTGPYCNRCGQKAHLHRTVSDFWHDLLHGVLHFDGKLWRTLPLLVWRPGDLTRRYIHGERARFVSPLALFLFAVFITFAVFQYGGHSEARSNSRSIAEANVVSQDLKEQIAKLDARIKAARARGENSAALESERAEVQTGLDVIETAGDWGLVTKDNDVPLSSKSEAENGNHVTVEGNAAAISMFRNFIGKVKKNPDLLLYKMQNYAYKYAWAMIPFSALWLWLLYAFDRRYPYYDHIVFVTYSLGFMLLFTSTLIIMTRMGLSVGVAVTAFFLYAPYHIYRQLKGAYRGGRAVTLLRTFAMVIGAWVILLIFGSALVALGIA